MSKLSDPSSLVRFGPVAAGSPTVAAVAERRLKASPYPALRRLHCDFHEGVLTLRGRVPSYYHKQMACTLVAHLKGVEEFVDRIEVVDMRAGASS